MTFIHDDFLLRTEVARRLYHGYATNQPILDYHCHLSPRDIAHDRQFKDLAAIWLEGDHYKWRAMRANGEAEEFCTGKAQPYQKFLAWARTVPSTIGNPLFHWTHLELKRYFGIDTLLNEETAPAIWESGNEALSQPNFTVRGILRKFRVKVVCTTDDPADNLAHHCTLVAEEAFRVLPTFRPDNALKVMDCVAFNTWVDRLGRAANIEVSSFDSFVSALESRFAYFHAHGCRLADHGLERCYSRPCTHRLAAGIFDRARRGAPANEEEHAGFAAFILRRLGQLYCSHEWTMQLHLGARRNNSSRALRVLGPDTGFDSIGGHAQVDALCEFLDSLDAENSLPRTIVYNLNPADNYAIAAAIGNFQQGPACGKLQFGSGWWFLDQKQGIEWQLSTLANLGLLANFVGMVTDSRSFMSFPRHEYFRRVLCNYLGDQMHNGELPNDEPLIGEIVARICYENARRYLNLPNQV